MSWRFKTITVSVLFSFSIMVLWIIGMGGKDKLLAVIGAFYAILCLGFLFMQIAAFAKAHLDYDEALERPKFDPILKEEVEWPAF